MPSEKHLELINGIIARLAGNSFQMKSWNVALTAAVIGFVAAKDSPPGAAVLATAPSVAFWFLDGYYLGLERLYRNLYKDANSGAKTAYDLNAGELRFGTWIRAVFRISVVALHLPMIAVILAVSLEWRGR